MHDNEDKTKENKNWTKDKIYYWTHLHSVHQLIKFAWQQQFQEIKAVKPLIGISILRNGLNCHRPKITEQTEWLPWTCLCDFDCIQWSQQIKNSSARLVNYWTE